MNIKKNRPKNFVLNLYIIKAINQIAMEWNYYSNGTGNQDRIHFEILKMNEKNIILKNYNRK